MVIVYSRQRRQVKTTLKHTGRGLFLAACLVLITALSLPWVLRSPAEPLVQVSFSDLLRIAADEAPQITEATFFSIDIPRIGAKSRIIPNVNSADKFEYGQALARGVAHAAGTFLPGMDGSVTLFAHSTDFEARVSQYNAIFYRLDELTAGDLVTIWYLGKKYDYRVVDSRVVPPSDVSVFTGQSGEPKLYLVTCTPRGTTKNRLIVEAERLTP
jgi:LPXTG-site transpeptidase (sortase) family protein